MKKVIAGLLAFVLLLSGLPTQIAHASAGDEENALSDRIVEQVRYYNMQTCWYLVTPVRYLQANPR